MGQLANAEGEAAGPSERPACAMAMATLVDWACPECLALVTSAHSGLRFLGEAEEVAVGEVVAHGPWAKLGVQSSVSRVPLGVPHWNWIWCFLTYASPCNGRGVYSCWRRAPSYKRVYRLGTPRQQLQ